MVASPSDRWGGPAAVARSDLVDLRSSNPAAGLSRATSLWCMSLVTANDNVDALAFYLRRGLKLAAVNQDALSWGRQLSASIPEIGCYGIPIEDELELELVYARTGW
ncbi:MAG: hypothetical protein ACYDGN_05385 [Acidimicrobiales bacterium]